MAQDSSPGYYATMEGAVVIGQMKQKNKRPTMKDLNRYVVKRHATDWYDIGIELGLELDVLDIIEKDCPQSSVSCFQKTLNKWLKLNAVGATWRVLEVALTNVNRTNLGLSIIDDIHGGVDSVDNVYKRLIDDKPLTPSVVEKLHDDLCIDYKRSRQRPCEEEWPPEQPSSTVNLALIHYQSRRTHQELIEISNRCKGGASHLDKLTASNSNVTKDIQKIFLLEDDTKLPKRILIEGAPGIGKTVLAREIAYQWAIGKILQEYKLVFLLFLREPILHEVKSINEILKFFPHEKTRELKSYVAESYGNKVAFVFDGFDEYPTGLQEQSFITDLIKGDKNGKNFSNSMVVITSRPTATLFLHGIVDRRIEILGFPKEEREKYISLSLRDSLERIQKLHSYLKLHPIIDNLCYIPLHLSILMYLFQQDSLPETLTEMNELFIINTIYRYLERNKLSLPGEVKCITHFPSNIVNFIYKLSHLAFNGLQNNQLVFKRDEILNICSEVGNISGAINGFGLLQAVQHYPQRGAGKTTSVNFLHFTMQEYLAALHVSTLSYEKQLSVIKERFWHGHFSFMWMMYVGIVGVKLNAFASFIESDSNWNNIYNDKRKCLHLFQCYLEAKSDAEMPQVISSIFTDGKITLNDITLLPHHISSLLFFMSTSSKQHWKILSISYCNLGDIGMNNLLEHVIRNDEKTSTLEYVDLSGNGSSPWSVYCTIISNCCINSLTLCGDKGMKKYVKDIIVSLERNLVLESLTICKITHIGIELIKEISGNYTTLHELNLSWGSKANGTRILKRLLQPASHSNNEVYVNILYDDNHECLSRNINLSQKKIDDNAACVIAFGIHNNNTVEKLDLSHNKIGVDGMSKLSQCVKHAISLNYVDLSENYSSPWNVYCAIIEHSYVSSLTLCGDVGMDKYAKNIMDNLQKNLMLESLTMCKIGCTGIQIIESILVNTTLKEINISWGRNPNGTKVIKRLLKPASPNEVVVTILCDDYHEHLSKTVNLSNKKIDDDAVYVIAFGLRSNNNNIMNVQKLDLSHNNIAVSGMNKLSECVKHVISLKYLDLNENHSSPWGVYHAVIRHCCVSDLTLCGDEGMKEYVEDIIESLQSNLMLKSLTLCKIGRIGIHSVERILAINTNLKELNLSWGSNANGIKIIERQKLLNSSSKTNVSVLHDDYHEYLSKTINLSNKNIDDDAVYVIACGLYYNTMVEKLDLSHNKITVNGMNKLSKSIKYTISLKYVDLSGNESSQWSVYCAIIRHCSVNKLTLCGDEGMKDYVEEIMDSVQMNATLQSLILCGAKSNLGRYQDMLVKVNNVKLKTPQDILVIDGKLCFSTLDSDVDEDVTDKRVVNVKIFYDGNCECLSETISLCNTNINDDTVCLITLGLYNNTIVTKIDLSCNYITGYGALKISDMLKHNKTVKELNLSRNLINIGGLFILSERIKYAEYVDLSGNQSSPWDGYCAIIRHCHVSKLTLFGDKGMAKRVKEVIDSLQINTTLQLLTLCASKSSSSRNEDIIEVNNTDRPQNTLIMNGELHFSMLVDDNEEITTGNRVVHIKIIYEGLGAWSNGDEEVNNKRVVNIKIIYDGGCECPPETVNLSNSNVYDDTVCLITFGLYNNATVKMLDFSYNKICDDGAKIIFDCLKHNRTIQKLDISHNSITDNGIMPISGYLKHNNTLKELNLSHNHISFDKRMSNLSEYIKYITSLEYVDLSGNWSSPWGIYCAIIRHCSVNSLTLCGDEGMKEYIKDITDCLEGNAILQSLTLCKIGRIGLQSIKSVLDKSTTLKELNMSWMSKGTKIIHRKMMYHKLNSRRSVSNSSEEKMDINILYDGDHECSSEVINMSNKDINDDALYLIIFGLHNSTKMQVLDLSCNNITNDGAVAISDCCRNSCSLHVLVLSQNSISCNGAKKISEIIQMNKVILKLDLSHNIIQDDGAIAISECLRTKSSLQELNLSDNQITSKGAKKIAEAIRVNNGLRNLDLLQNAICDDGVKYISDSLRNNHVLLVLNLSKSGITDKGGKIIAEAVQLNTTLQKLDLSHNKISDDVATVISNHLKENVTT